jgi:hypothetical protein
VVFQAANSSIKKKKKKKKRKDCMSIFVYWEVPLVHHTPTLDPMPSAFCLDENIKPMAQKKKKTHDNAKVK